MSTEIYEIHASEYCDDAPGQIEIDVNQFRDLSQKVSAYLKEIGFSYACQWFAGADYKLYDESVYENVDAQEVELPYGYHQHLKVYSDGSVQLVWEHKHDASCEFWVNLGVVTA